MDEFNKSQLYTEIEIIRIDRFDTQVELTDDISIIKCDTLIAEIKDVNEEGLYQ